MSFAPAHRVGSAPIPTWPSADQSQPAGPNFDPGLEVQLVEQQGELTKIACSNGWEAWVGDEYVAVAVVNTAPDPAHETDRLWVRAGRVIDLRQGQPAATRQGAG